MSDDARCPACGTELPPSALACPLCHRLVHGDRLKSLAASAEASERAGDPRAALLQWREALALLPAESRQRAVIDARVATLVRTSPTTTSPTRQAPDPAPQSSEGWSGKAAVGGLGALGLLLFKFKFVLVLLLTKLKFLALGLSKLSTVSSMLLSFGYYFAIWGWQFGASLIAAIYVHEMGHVYQLHRFGIRAGAPLFIPGLGAIVSLFEPIDDPWQEARVALGGPIWGLAAAAGFYGLGLSLSSMMMLAVARVLGTIHIFNLIPVWQLDGGRAFRALTRPERWLAAAAVGLAWAITHNPFLIFVALGAAYRALAEPGAKTPDRPVLLQYVAAIAVASALASLHVKA